MIKTQLNRSIILIYVNSIENTNVKKANDFFIHSSNLLKDNISFNIFFDGEPKYLRHARAMYAQYLMNKGGQSGIQKYIKELLKLHEIYKLVEKRKDEIIKKYPNKNIAAVQYNKKKIKFDSTISDFHVIFGNDRQVYSKLGFLPPQKNGVSVNNISKIVYDSNNEEMLNLICEHQMFIDKMYNYGKQDKQAIIIKMDLMILMLTHL